MKYKDIIIGVIIGALIPTYLLFTREQKTIESVKVINTIHKVVIKGADFKPTIIKVPELITVIDSMTKYKHDTTFILGDYYTEKHFKRTFTHSDSLSATFTCLITQNALKTLDLKFDYIERETIKTVERKMWHLYAGGELSNIGTYAGLLLQSRSGNVIYGLAVDPFGALPDHNGNSNLSLKGSIYFRLK